MPRKRIKPKTAQPETTQLELVESKMPSDRSEEQLEGNSTPSDSAQSPHPLDVLCRQISIVSNLPPEQLEKLKGELGIGSLPRGRAFNRISEVLAITVALRREIREERANP